ncbi:MAG: DUF445 domain-containing protein, partial [Actinomycetota bacterium]|nr:DUF445 domain-containing protein [Actinomycetota bacterium]
QERIDALRRMKRIAGSLLLVAAVVYVVCRVAGDGNGVWGYIQATAEASMVGGLADWFAVTALFRHPLRIPIPHTAIIPNKKDQIGEGLASFVQEYFLTTEVLAERIDAAQVPQRLGEWLADPDHARRLGDELSNTVSGVANVLRDDELRKSVAAFADKRLRELDIATLLARLIDAICDAGQHQAALSTFLRGARKFLESNKAVFRQRVAEESPEWVPEWLDERVFNKGFSLLQSFLSDVISDDQHGLRKGFDAQLRELAEQLRIDPERIAKVEAARDQVLDHPNVHDYLNNLWDAMKKLLLDETGDSDSDLRRSTVSLTVRGGEVLRDDPAVRDKVNEALHRLSGHVATHYADDITAVISSTIARWDTDETSRRLELQVGRDLQFIRINGTVVGALAGLAIYTLTQLF